MRTLSTTEVNHISGGNADAFLASLVIGGIVTAGVIAAANQPYYYYNTYPYYGGYGCDYYVYDTYLYSPYSSTVVVYDDYYYDEVVYVY